MRLFLLVCVALRFLGFLVKSTAAIVVLLLLGLFLIIFLCVIVSWSTAGMYVCMYVCVVQRAFLDDHFLVVNSLNLILTLLSYRRTSYLIVVHIMYRFFFRYANN